MQAEQRGARQTAYQILVAASEERLHNRELLLWDSGKVISDNCVHIPLYRLTFTLAATGLVDSARVGRKRPGQRV